MSGSLSTAFRRALCALLPALLLSACAVTPTERVVPAALLADERFAPPAEPVEDANEIFALSPAMRDYLRGDIAAQLRTHGRHRGLIDALYARSQLKLEYDTARTRNASEAFEARSGNCLSLAIMTAAFAKALDLAVRYQSATVDETWSRSGDLVLKSGHVNITLGRRLMDAGSARELSPLTVDFLPVSELRGLHTRDIDEPTVVAMYQNNRAAEALSRGRVDDAYWWARAAVRARTLFEAPLNTLGVVYMRHGDVDLAERTFRQALARSPRNTDALANLAHTLARQPSRAAEATSLYARLAQLESDPPFHHYALGRLAMQRGDWQEARDQFEREAARTDFHEVHFWLAMVELQLGHAAEARRHLSTAMQNSTTRQDHDLYAAKLQKMSKLAGGATAR